MSGQYPIKARYQGVQVLIWAFVPVHDDMHTSNIEAVFTYRTMPDGRFTSAKLKDFTLDWQES